MRLGIFCEGGRAITFSTERYRITKVVFIDQRWTSMAKIWEDKDELQNEQICQI